MAEAIRSGSVVRQGPRTASRTIDGRSVVVVVDRQRLHTLNELGTFLWERLGNCTVEQLTDAVVAAYDVKRDRALQDVVAFIDALLREGAVELVSE